ncbi:DUF6192 family protein [Amycolatopsis sp. EV170708-02-1]|uniref:DUF6192 family protein n=1 Tax=Amycolatopsis sp. EV170708-02-1 TaxID=2919322 RepID=UPI001F0C17A4|nr:DUF6192 family protein [Amycolatopsis sp. EV170708-02-1]UMP06833.1 DUF6192 family protein [Amycolatopsis sp. EV170708-02-1]
MGSKIGNVTRRRYDQLVQVSREAVEAGTTSRFTIGDSALEIEPMRDHGGAAGDEPMPVSEALAMFAEDIGLAYTTVRGYRWVSSRWPDKRIRRRNRLVSYSVFRILASIPEPEERARQLADPPLLKCTGDYRWTPDAAKRVVGWAVDTPQSPQEKVNRIHDLARDDEVAAVVATDLLRRPEVASRAMTDHTARHAVNRAQVDHAQQAEQIARQRTPVLEQLSRTGGFVELVGACSVFVASVSRVLPNLRGHRFSKEETATIATNVARVRSTADWIESSVATGEMSMDEGLAKLLRGE